MKRYLIIDEKDRQTGFLKGDLERKSDWRFPFCWGKEITLSIRKTV